MTQSSRILIVDDEENNVDLLSRYVQRAGYQVTTATNGADAIDQAVENPPDLVLLDWMMPELSGIDVLRALREQYDVNQMPIIMCTALDEADHVVAALSEGANDFVSKPINPVILRARMTAQLERRDGMAALGDLNSRLESLVAERTRALARMSETAHSKSGFRPDDMKDLNTILDAVAFGRSTDIFALRSDAERLLNLLTTDAAPDSQEAGIGT